MTCLKLNTTNKSQRVCKDRQQIFRANIELVVVASGY